MPLRKWHSAKVHWEIMASAKAPTVTESELLLLTGMINNFLWKHQQLWLIQKLSLKRHLHWRCYSQKCRRNRLRWLEITQKLFHHLKNITSPIQAYFNPV
jgi:hypothetical protein